MWSQLLETEIAELAMSIYGEEHRKYHNYEHILTMYNWATILNIPYDINLDLAIMFHDIVYDAEPEKELRSANLFRQWYSDGKIVTGNPFLDDCIDPDYVFNLILVTEKHMLSHETHANSIIFLDLADLMNFHLAARNFVNIAEEVNALYPNLDVEDFISKHVDFMYGLKSRLMLGKTCLYETHHVALVDKIIEGIDFTVNYAESFYDDEEDEDDDENENPTTH